MHAWQMAEAVRGGAASAVDLARDALGLAETRGSELGAFLHVDREGALARAAEVDRRRARGDRLGRLAGVPVAVKDAICTRGLPTTAGARVLEGWVPPYDATVIARLAAADAVVIGKTNLDAFAMGSSTETSAFFPARNPWDPARTPGGSSGGSAAAVGARVVSCALGSDTGGSIRQPAAFTGTVGLKPTYGRVSRYGLVAFASSLDQIGPFATDVRGAARLLDVISGHDARDATSAVRAPSDTEGACDAPPGPLRIGVPEEYFTEGLDAEIRASVRAAIHTLATDHGATLVPVRLPHTRHAVL